MFSINIISVKKIFFNTFFAYLLNMYLIAAREKFQILKMARTIKKLGHPCIKDVCFDRGFWKFQVNEWNCFFIFINNSTLFKVMKVGRKGVWLLLLVFLQLPTILETFFRIKNGHRFWWICDQRLTQFLCLRYRKLLINSKVEPM